MNRFVPTPQQAPLKDALSEAGLSYAELARELGVSKIAVVRLVNEDRWPRSRPKEELRAAIGAALAARSVHTKDLWPTTQVSGGEKDDPDEEVDMRVQLSMEARQQFRLARDPWEVNDAGDVWLGGRWRFAAQAMEDCAEKSGGLLAVVGESGCGKSTIRRYVLDRLRSRDRPVQVIEPITIDRSRLTAGLICDAIIFDVAPTERPRRSLEYKTRQVRRVLTESSRSGVSHVLMIEEAHDLSVSTLKYLKRFWELEDGFSRLLSIVLLGQPEIMTALDSQSWAVREVVRRIEVAELGALDRDGELEDFLDARIGRAAFAEDAYGAIRERLSRRTRAGQVSTAWPLAVANLVTRALNYAAEIDQAEVTASTVAAA